MDFKSVTEKLTTAFEGKGVLYGLIGGYAVSLWGLPRATVDLDFLVRREDMTTVRNIAESLGYRCIHSSDNVTQFDSDDVNLGEIDFLHAFRPASMSMLERLELKEIFDGHVRVPVIQPEDLIGLKIQAIANSPARMAVDRGDIEGLMQLHTGNMDWQRIEEYFALFSMMDLFNELKERYHAAQQNS